MTALARVIRRHLVAPFTMRGVPAHELSLGAGLGAGFALLPIVGQLYLAPVLWAAGRAWRRTRFNFPAALAMVLIVNPPVKVPLFYGYLLTGEALLDAIGVPHSRGAAEFRVVMNDLLDGTWAERPSAMMRALTLALEHYALPLGIGGCAWALVVGLAVGLGTHWALRRRG
jgi:hypothetical protein